MPALGRAFMLPCGQTRAAVALLQCGQLARVRAHQPSGRPPAGLAGLLECGVAEMRRRDDSEGAAERGAPAARDSLCCLVKPRTGPGHGVTIPLTSPAGLGGSSMPPWPDHSSPPSELAAPAARLSSRPVTLHLDSKLRCRRPACAGRTGPAGPPSQGRSGQGQVEPPCAL